MLSSHNVKLDIHVLHFCYFSIFVAKGRHAKIIFFLVVEPLKSGYNPYTPLDLSGSYFFLHPFFPLMKKVFFCIVVQKVLPLLVVRPQKLIFLSVFPKSRWLIIHYNSKNAFTICALYNMLTFLDPSNKYKEYQPNKTI